jgi:hypothetical protein
MTGEEKNISFLTPTPGAYSLEEAKQRGLAWKEAQKRATELMDLDFVKRVISETVKHDEEAKLITFFAMVLNYTYEDQQGIIFSAPSSTGKSWIALEIAKFFPKEDVDSKGYTSRRAFFHMNQDLQTADGKPLEKRADYLRQKMEGWEGSNPKPHAPDTSDKTPEAVRLRKVASDWKEKRKEEYRKHRDTYDALDKVYIVDLAQRILIWKDMPDDGVLQPLRSLMSHDEKELIADITDKSQSGSNLTKRVKLLGYPTVIFCQAGFSPDDQERTRNFIVSPDMDQEKLSDSLGLQAETLRNRPGFQQRLDTQIERMALKARIEAIKAENIQQIMIEESDINNALKWYKRGKDGRPRDLTPRDQRDWPRLIAMAKGHDLFNLFQRKRTPEGYVIATTEDLEVAKTILGRIVEANRLGMPPYVYDWWAEDLSKTFEAQPYGLTKNEFNASYFGRFKTRLGDKARKNLIKSLEETGLIEERTDPDDKRTTKLYATGVGVRNEINISQESPKLQDFIGKSGTLLQEDTPASPGLKPEEKIERAPELSGGPSPEKDGLKEQPPEPEGPEEVVPVTVEAEDPKPRVTLEERFRQITKIFEESHNQASTDYIASRLGVTSEEMEKLLRAMTPHVFTVPGSDLWRFSP